MTDEDPDDRRSKTILIVDDEPKILSLLKVILEKKGYNVITASKPAQALQVVDLHRESIGLLLTDVLMPEMNGQELSELVKAIIPDIKVIFISGYTADIIAEQDSVSEGVNFIRKPFSLRELYSTISASLKGR
jgi:DNA-binding NtrC family response regulator